MLPFLEQQAMAAPLTTRTVLKHSLTARSFRLRCRCLCASASEPRSDTHSAAALALVSARGDYGLIHEISGKMAVAKEMPNANNTNAHQGCSASSRRTQFSRRQTERRTVSSSPKTRAGRTSTRHGRLLRVRTG